MAGLAPGASIGSARRLLARAFRTAGIDTPELDARLLIGHALGLDHTALVSAGERPLNAADAVTIEIFATRRLGGEPVARILGEWAFWGLTLRLNEATLVPRPDTETIVEAALAAIDHGGSRARPLRIADLGTGSGALLLALLSELPQAFGVGTDISATALAAARGNAVRLGLGSRAGFVACDYGAALAGGFDLVVVNPPYIPSNDIGGLSAEVRHDPVRALDGGLDGLDGYRTIAADARRLLAANAHLVLELGIGQEFDVAEILADAGLAVGPARPDVSGVPRALTGCCNNAAPARGRGRADKKALG